MSATIIIGVNLIVDVLYGVINPRIRHSMSETDAARHRAWAAPPRPLRASCGAISATTAAP